VDAAQSGITSVGTLTGLTLDGDKSVTPGNGAMVHLDTSTITDSATAGSGTAAKYTHVALEAPTLAATNASVTTSDAATLYINNAATAGTNQTITRNWAMWVDAGNVRFDGSIYSGTTEALSSAGLVTVANQSNITGVGTIATGTWEGTTVAVAQGGTGATSLTNLITLATHTTGDYVQNITAGTGLTSTGATSGENIAHSLSVDAAQTGITSLGTQAADFKIGNGYGLLVGHASQVTAAGTSTAEVQVLGTSGSDSMIKVGRFGADEYGPSLTFLKSRDPAIADGSFAIVADNDLIGRFRYAVDDGADFNTEIARIEVEVDDGSPAENAVGGAIVLRTATTSGSMTEAFRISSAQDATFAGAIYIKDDEKIIFGNGSDASIEYDENGTDQLRIAGNTVFENQIEATLDIEIDSTPADETVSGVTATFTAGEALVRGEVCYFKAADSKMWKAVATAAATSRCVAMAAADISADAAGLFLLQGFLADNGSFPSYTIGGALYTPEAETSGENVPEQTAPDTDGDFVQVIGWAMTANSVYFNPSNDIIEHA